MIAIDFTTIIRNTSETDATSRDDVSVGSCRSPSIEDRALAVSVIYTIPSGARSKNSCACESTSFSPSYYGDCRSYGLFAGLFTDSEEERANVREVRCRETFTVLFLSLVNHFGLLLSHLTRIKLLDRWTIANKRC